MKMYQKVNRKRNAKAYELGLHWSTLVLLYKTIAICTTMLGGHHHRMLTKPLHILNPLPHRGHMHVTQRIIAGQQHYVRKFLGSSREHGDRGIIG